ncbi:MAG TPA: permease [Devosia sp.]|jgi:ABC-2 type transport system permease protein|uniref:permease n=1 Tax=Devosia sp. TaxID=1871048 RepID=UPI002F95A8EF
MRLAPGSVVWFARHELTLGWRDWVAMMTGRQHNRSIVLTIFIAIVMVLLHLMAFGLVSPWTAQGISPTPATLTMLTGTGLLFWTVMLSQALEAVTRVYYGRSDLDLVLSSPASAPRLFVVRTGAVTLTSILLPGLLASPMVNMLAYLDGAHWLSAYGVIGALGAISTALALLVTLALFRLVGPKRTRLIAQIVAAIVGAGFAIGVQAAAILHYGNMSRFALFQKDELVTFAPAPESPLWLPAKAAMGDLPALLIMIAVAAGLLSATAFLAAPSYGRHATAAAGASYARPRRFDAIRPFRSGSPRQALRRKEWRLLQRDPWLLSQTLMQILYLLPPALLLWLNFGAEAGAFVVLVPVLVMAAGQLAGGLAWLAISGEDAHDLVATSPVTPRTILVAKIEAVLAVIAIVLAPLLLLLAFSAPQMALITTIFAAISAGSATAIQLWFRVVSKRSMFRRRQVASRAATLSEAFSSIMWAGTGALVAAGSWLAIASAIAAIGTLGLAKLISPDHS